MLAELQEIAGELKIDGASSMRKGELIDAIKAARGDAKPAKAAADPSADADEAEKPKQGGNRSSANKAGQGGQGGQTQQSRGGDADGDEGPGRRRNRRGRNRSGNRGPDGEPVITDDDVLVPAAGILDILDNYAFVRTTGYYPSESDVYVSLSMVK